MALSLSSLRQELKEEQQASSDARQANEDILAAIKRTQQEILDGSQKVTKELAEKQAQMVALEMQRRQETKELEAKAEESIRKMMEQSQREKTTLETSAKHTAEETVAKAEQHAKEILKSAKDVHAQTTKEMKQLTEETNLHLARTKEDVERKTIAIVAAAKLEADALHQRTATENKTRLANAAATAKEMVETAKISTDTILATAQTSAADTRKRCEEECKTERDNLKELQAREAVVQARLNEIKNLVANDGNRRIVLDVRGTLFRSTLKTLCDKFPRSLIARIVSDDKNKISGEESFFIDGDPTYFHHVLTFLNRGVLPAVEGMAQLKWLEQEASWYDLPELVNECRLAHKRLDVIDVMQLLNGQKNLSGMDMRGLTMSDIDFSNASLYHAQLQHADMKRIVAQALPDGQRVCKRT